MDTPPEFPAGPFEPPTSPDRSSRADLIDEIQHAPVVLSRLASGLSDARLDTKYRLWTLRQIVHHLADSHAHSYLRFKWALTEDLPTIKPYEEADWVSLPDSRLGDISPPLVLLTGLHARWVQLLRTMTPDQFSRSFLHPQSASPISLDHALSYYAWHGRHHTAQISWRLAHPG